jgi:2-polyprenyl-3-methyl-5-hydroxy-6-metoxy-1,4-benzoquinol methylase
MQRTAELSDPGHRKKIMSEESHQALNREAREIWNQKAAFWDGQYGDEGNRFHRLLVAPAVERLLEVRPDERVLDIACGNGVVSRRLAQLGAQVLALDFSEELLGRARARTTEHAARIDYQLVDATDEGQMIALGEGQFDAAVCTQALMDLPVIEPLLAALGRLLRPGGRLVFSIGHPCFNSVGSQKVAVAGEQDGEVATGYAVQVSQYIRPSMEEQGVGIVGEPAPHPYFHRPLSVLFNACFRAGFVLDGMEEPVYPVEVSGERWFSWANFKEIPPALVARMRLTPP